MPVCKPPLISIAQSPSSDTIGLDAILTQTGKDIIMKMLLSVLLLIVILVVLFILLAIPVTFHIIVGIVGVCFLASLFIYPNDLKRRK